MDSKLFIGGINERIDHSTSINYLLPLSTNRQEKLLLFRIKVARFQNVPLYVSTLKILPLSFKTRIGHKYCIDVAADIECFI
jgi:hypothetical protein